MPLRLFRAKAPQADAFHLATARLIGAYEAMDALTTRGSKATEFDAFLLEPGGLEEHRVAFIRLRSSLVELQTLFAGTQQGDPALAKRGETYRSACDLVAHAAAVLEYVASITALASLRREFDLSLKKYDKAADQTAIAHEIQALASVRTLSEQIQIFLEDVRADIAAQRTLAELVLGLSS